MRKLFLLVILLPSITTMGQNSVYHPFPDSNATWNIHALFFTYPPINDYYTILISGDTLINNIEYHKLLIPYIQSARESGIYHTVAGYNGAIRQDTVNKKVFIIPTDSITEQLLYDFDMQVGDTVKGYIENMLNQKDVVESIDSVLVDNSFRKRWKINSIYNIFFIEGVGSTYGLIEYSPGSVIDAPDFSITCFSQNGVTIYPDTVTNCEIITSVHSVKTGNYPIKIYPNPSKVSFTIETDNTLCFKEFLVIDRYGKILIREPFKDTSMVNIKDLQPGFYIVKIIDNNDLTTNIKIVVNPE